MTAAFRQALHRQPFEPFALRLADGQPLPVPHPDFFAVGTRRIVAIHDNDSWALANPLLIVSVSKAACFLMAALKRYAIVIEKAATNYAAYVPDLPGRVVMAATVKETERLLRGAIELHLRRKKEVGLPISELSSVVDYLELDSCV